MAEIIALIISYASMWAPALVAIFGTVTTVVLAINKCRDAIEGFKKDDTLRELKEEVKRVSQENQELVRCNKLLLEQITQIKGYADVKKKEG